MTVRRLCATAGIALVSSGVVAATTKPATPQDVPARAVQLIANDDPADTDPTTVALIMGGSGEQILSPGAVANANEVYIQPHFGDADARPLGYPAQLYPLHGAHQGFLQPSSEQGQRILDSAIMTEIGEGHRVVVFGTSQSATIQTLELRHLASLPPDERPSPEQLGFVNYGDPNLPNGGMLSRFDIPNLPDDRLSIPTLGITFNGPTPIDTPYETHIYTGEYDGFADFPRYPLNLLADFNALLGIPFVHDHGSSKPASLIDQAIELDTSPGYDGDTTFYLVPTADLPLLESLRFLPVVGDPLADLLQPALRVLVNLGYGPGNVGYSEFPDVTTGFGVFPDVDPATVFTNLIDGVKEGLGAFWTDIQDISPASIAASITQAGPEVTPLDLDPDNFISELQRLLTVNSDALATLVASPLDNFMPLVDTLTALGITLPTYGINIMLAGLDQLANGDPEGIVTALGGPLAGAAGLGSISTMVFLQSALSTTEPVLDALQTAFTADINFIAGLPGLLW